MEKQIYYHDTDWSGVVYYANYLKYLEEGRTEYFHQRGVDLLDYAKNGFLFAVAHLEADYEKPARYGDTISIISSVEKARNCSIHFLQEVKRGKDLLFKAKVVLCCVTESLKPCPIPESMKAALSKE